MTAGPLNLYLVIFLRRLDPKKGAYEPDMHFVFA